MAGKSRAKVMDARSRAAEAEEAKQNGNGNGNGEKKVRGQGERKVGILSGSTFEHQPGSFEIIADPYGGLPGKHIVREGSAARIYKQGDVIESEYSLDEMFPNKFRRLDEPTRVGPDEMKSLISKDNTMDLRLADLPPEEQEEKTVLPSRQEDAKTQARVRGEEAYKMSQERMSAKQKTESKLGSDVSNEFPEAKKNDFVVFKDDEDGYYVADKDAPNKALNKKALPQEEVEGFIKEQAE